MTDSGELLPDDLGGPELVIGVHEAEQEHHRDGLTAQGLQSLHAAADRVLVHLEQDVALEVDPLRDRDAGPTAGDGDGRRRGRVPDLLLVDATHLDLVAVAFGDEQAGRGPVHLDHRVVGGGGAVHQDVGLVAELAQAQAELLGQLPEPRHDPSRLVVQGGGGLVQHDLARGGDRDEVGERAPDVDAYAVTVNHGVGPEAPLSPRRRRPASGPPESR